MEKIDSSSFKDWKDHPVTKKLMEIFIDNDNLVEERMLNGETIMSENSGKILSYCLGLREAFGKFLHLELRDLEEREEDDQA